MSSTGKSYDNVLLVKNEVFVFKIPPRQSNRGYRAADWTLDNPDWTGRLRVIANGKDLALNLEDKNSGALFAKCPIDQYPGVAVESVLDSSRYFVIRLQDENGRNAYVGIGFADRSDSFDMNVAIQDHFKWLKQEAEAAEVTAKLGTEPALDLGFKEGQTIRLQLNTKRTGDDNKQKTRNRPTGSGSAIGLLPPPPGSKSAHPIGTIAPPSSQHTPAKLSMNTNEFDLLGGDFSMPPAPSSNTNTDLSSLDDWMKM